jgi:hypothetical protein
MPNPRTAGTGVAQGPNKSGICAAKSSPTAAPPQASLRFRRLSQHLHSLGPRPLGEFLLELGRVHGLEREIVGMLEEFAALDPLLVERLEARNWPAPPIEVVP